MNWDNSTDKCLDKNGYIMFTTFGEPYDRRGSIYLGHVDINQRSVNTGSRVLHICEIDHYAYVNYQEEQND